MTSRIETEKGSPESPQNEHASLVDSNMIPKNPPAAATPMPPVSFEKTKEDATRIVTTLLDLLITQLKGRKYSHELRFLKAVRAKKSVLNGVTILELKNNLRSIIEVLARHLKNVDLEDLIPVERSLEGNHPVRKFFNQMEQLIEVYQYEDDADISDEVTASEMFLDCSSACILNGFIGEGIRIAEKITDRIAKTTAWTQIVQILCIFEFYEKALEIAYKIGDEFKSEKGSALLQIALSLYGKKRLIDSLYVAKQIPHTHFRGLIFQPLIHAFLGEANYEKAMECVQFLPTYSQQKCMMEMILRDLCLAGKIEECDKLITAIKDPRIRSLTVRDFEQIKLLNFCTSGSSDEFVEMTTSY